MGGKSGGGTALQQQPVAPAAPVAPVTPAPTGTNVAQTQTASQTAAPAAPVATTNYAGKGAGKGGGGAAQLQTAFNNRNAMQLAPNNAPAISGMGTTGGIASLAQTPQSSMFADEYGNAGAGTATVDPYAAQANTGIAGIPGTAEWSKIQQMQALQSVGVPQVRNTPNGVAPRLPTVVSRGESVAKPNSALSLGSNLSLPRDPVIPAHVIRPAVAPAPVQSVANPVVAAQPRDVIAITSNQPGRAPRPNESGYRKWIVNRSGNR